MVYPQKTKTPAPPPLQDAVVNAATSDIRSSLAGYLLNIPTAFPDFGTVTDCTPAARQ